MRKIAVVLLSGFISIYCIIGGFSLYIYLIELWIKLSQRKASMSEQEVELPYPILMTVGFFFSIIAFIVIGFYIIHIIRIVCNSLNNTRFTTKLILIVIPTICGLLLSLQSINYWITTPPISREEALKIALMENNSGRNNITSEYSRTIFKEIEWDDVNHRWIVVFSDNSGNSCDYISISRLGITITGGSCTK